MADSRHNRADITFGVILIGIGALFLLNTFDIIGYNVWHLLSRSWPLFLILIGLNILVRQTKIWWITPLLLVIVFVSLLFPHPRNIIYWNLVGRPARQVENHTETLDSQMMFDPEIDIMDIHLRVDAGRIDISHLDDEMGEEEEKLYDLSFEYREEQPEIDYEFDSSEGLGILSVHQRQRFQLEEIDIINHASLALNDRIPYRLNIESGAGHYELDFSRVQIDDLEINSGVSDLSITFGEYSSEVEISSGASNMNFDIPAGVGFRIDTENVVSNDNFEEMGLEEVDPNTFETEDFAAQEHQIHVVLSSPASNINVEVD